MRHRLQDNPRNKRYFWSLLVTVFLWLFVAGVIVFVDPADTQDVIITGGYLPLMIPLSLAFWFSTSLLLGNSLIGGVLTVGAVVSVYLRLIEIGSWWIILPWWGVVLCVVAYLLFKGKVDKPEAD